MHHDPFMETMLTQLENICSDGRHPSKGMVLKYQCYGRKASSAAVTATLRDSTPLFIGIERD